MDATSAEQVTRQVAGLAEHLAKHAPWQEQHRRLHDESIEAFVDASPRKPSRCSMAPPEVFGVPRLPDAAHRARSAGGDVAGPHHAVDDFEFYGRMLCGLEQNSTYI